MRENNMKIEFDALSENESFARLAIAGFMASSDPTLEELEDVKTAVSEAVTNAIIHGYAGKEGKVILSGNLKEHCLTVIIQDFGVGITDVEQARKPMFTTREDLERSGMGFTFMEAFMDELHIESKVNQGTTITMSKRLRG